MANIVVNGRGTMHTSETANQVALQIHSDLGSFQQQPNGAPDIVRPRGWVMLQPSGTLVNARYIVSVSDTE